MQKYIRWCFLNLVIIFSGFEWFREESGGRGRECGNGLALGRVNEEGEI